MDTVSKKYNKIKFNAEEEEQIIDFVKNNEILYNVKHRQYRDSEAKHRLWLVVAKELNKDVNAVMKRWRSMRDYFIRNRERKSNGSTTSATVTKREESLLFLLQSSVLKRENTSKLESGIETPSTNHEDSITYMSDDANFDVFSEVDREYAIYESNGSSHFLESKKKKSTSTEAFEFLAYRPKVVDYTENKSNEDVQLFFDSMAATVRRFPRGEIAQIKMKIANLVGEVELSLSKETHEIIFANKVTPNE